MFARKEPKPNGGILFASKCAPALHASGHSVGATVFARKEPKPIGGSKPPPYTHRVIP